MISVAALRAMAAAGATVEMIIAAIEADQTAEGSAIERRREADRARQQRRRDKTSPSRESRAVRVTPVTARNLAEAAHDFGDPPAPRAAQKESSPTPPKEKTLTQKKSNNSRGTRLPDDWEPSREDVAFAKTQIDIKRIPHEVDKFKDWWKSKPGAGGTKLDWSATWRNWVRTAAERGPRGGPPTGPRPSAPVGSWKDDRSQDTHDAIREVNRLAGLSDDGAGSGPPDVTDFGEVHDGDVVKPQSLVGRNDHHPHEVRAASWGARGR